MENDTAAKSSAWISKLPSTTSSPNDLQPLCNQPSSSQKTQEIPELFKLKKDRSLASLPQTGDTDCIR